MKVVQFLRKPNFIVFSIERLFEDVRSALPKGVVVEVCENRYPSKELWRRICDMFRAARNQGDVNHVTGDVHFLTYLLKRCKTILTIHDCVTLERLNGARYWFFWYWLPANSSAVITVILESTKTELMHHLRSEKDQIEVIPDCVSTECQPHNKHFDDKGYDADSFIEVIESAEAMVVIPPRRNRKAARAYDEHLYRERKLVERVLQKLKYYRRISTRYERMAITYQAMLSLVATVIWSN